MTLAAGRAQPTSAVPAVGLGSFVLVTAVGLVVVTALVVTAANGLAQPSVAFAFAGLIALGELFRAALPGGRQSAPLAIAAGLAYALLLHVGNQAAAQSSWQVVAVAAAGMTVGALPHLAAGHPVGVTGMASRMLRIAIAAVGFRALAEVPAIRAESDLQLGVMAGLLMAGWAAECLVRALVRANSLHARFGVTLAAEFAVQFPLGVAVTATAILIALAAQVMGLAALAVFIAPLLVTQVAMCRYAGIRATYLETVRALARVTEAGGYVEDGHAHRVGQLAVAVGHEFGIAETGLLELEYAALMHDIGQLSLRNPIPRGATVLAPPEDQRRIAELGADVIGKAGVLDGVAEIVRCQGRPWQGPAGTPPVGSRIIHAASAFDDLAGPFPDVPRTLAALERLRQASTDYDPGVVEALAKVAHRQARRS
ncbi:MAG TPA: HD domain-containing phosphohydrolase [Streptosporangiaceae bacterium]|nr:HD domain-containing phosphohydrolase [Streptosporangiaceae bacterium]